MALLRIIPSLVLAFFALITLSGCAVPRAVVMTGTLAGEVPPGVQVKTFKVQPFLSRFAGPELDDRPLATAEILVSQSLAEAMASYADFLSRQGWKLEGEWKDPKDGLPCIASRQNIFFGNEELTLTPRYADPAQAVTILKMELTGDYFWAAPALGFLNRLVGLEIASPLWIVEFPLGWIL